MKYLVDTHVLLWHALDDPRLTPDSRRLLDDPAHQLMVSQATLWELAIKTSTGELTLGVPFPRLETELLDNGFQILPYEFEHYKILVNLPFHHPDPFDRFLIAQSIAEGLTILTHDERFLPYPARVVMV
jgi:PIN domain nuclease of toxin-antitoxin system